MTRKKEKRVDLFIWEGSSSNSSSKDTISEYAVSTPSELDQEEENEAVRDRLPRCHCPLRANRAPISSHHILRFRFR
jgi:hypothetical protein